MILRKTLFFFTLTIALFIIIVFVAPKFAFADDSFGGLVPQGCQKGCPCSICDFYNLGRNIISFLLKGIAVPVAAAMFLYGGVIMLTSQASEEQIKKGRNAIRDAIIGLAIAFFSYAVINVILGTLAFGIGVGASPGNWFTTLECTGGGGTSCDDLPPVTPGGNGPGPSDPAASRCYRDGSTGCTDRQRALLDGSGCPDPVSGGEGCAWDQNPKDIKAAQEKIAQFDNIVKQAAALYGVPPERIRAIIIAESSGNLNVPPHLDLDGGSSYGLMQIRLDTARDLDPSLKKLSDDQVIAKLEDPDYNIHLGTQYYADILADNGGDMTRASAEYNGGPMANKPSVNCPGLLRWECQWDSNGCYGTGRTDCKRNTGYKPTRVYTRAIDTMDDQLRY